MTRIHCEHHPGKTGQLDKPRALLNKVIEHPGYTESRWRVGAHPHYTQCADCRRWFLPGEITLNGGKT